jgi:hypothetical protein
VVLVRHTWTGTGTLGDFNAELELQFAESIAPTAGFLTIRIDDDVS